MRFEVFPLEVLKPDQKKEKNDHIVGRIIARVRITNLLSSFFLPDPQSVTVVTVGRQEGYIRLLAMHGAELTRQRLSLLVARLIRELDDEEEEEYPSGLTGIQLSILDAGSIYDPSTVLKWLFIFFHAGQSPVQAALFCHCHCFSLKEQLVVEPRRRSWSFLCLG